MFKRQFVSISAGCVAALVLILLAVEARADSIGFEFGMDDFSIMGLQNTSDNAAIEWLSITFYNNTFFDTTDDLPGAGSVTSGFQFLYGSEGVSAIFPDNDATDGAQTATIYFTGSTRPIHTRIWLSTSMSSLAQAEILRATRCRRMASAR